MANSSTVTEKKPTVVNLDDLPENLVDLIFRFGYSHGGAEGQNTDLYDGHPFVTLNNEQIHIVVSVNEQKATIYKNKWDGVHKKLQIEIAR